MIMHKQVRHSLLQSSCSLLGYRHEGSYFLSRFSVKGGYTCKEFDTAFKQLFLFSFEMLGSSSIFEGAVLVCSSDCCCFLAGSCCFGTCMQL